MLGVILISARILLGSLFLLAGWNKLRHPANFTRGLDGYGVRRPLRPFVKRLLPPVEIGLGLLVSLGILGRAPLAAIELLLGAFVVATLRVRGSIADCGCFGWLLPARTKLTLILRDAAIMLVGLLLLRFARRAPSTGAATLSAGIFVGAATLLWPEVMDRRRRKPLVSTPASRR